MDFPAFGHGLSEGLNGYVGDLHIFPPRLREYNSFYNSPNHLAQLTPYPPLSNRNKDYPASIYPSGRSAGDVKFSGTLLKFFPFWNMKKENKTMNMAAMPTIGPAWWKAIGLW
jgi:hypothetical protein